MLNKQRDRILNLSGFVIAAIFLAAAQLKGILLTFGPHISQQIEAAQGIIQGYPHWRIYQSRILGPFFADVVGKLFQLPFREAYLLAVFILLTVFFFILIITAKRLWNSSIIAIIVAMAAGLFNAIFMQGDWLYLWDYIDLIIFSLLLWSILTAKPVWLISSILVVEIFNREVAIILIIWFISDAIVRFKLLDVRWPKIEFKFRRRQFFVALALLVLGYITIELLRSTTLIKEIGPEIFPNIKESGRFVNIQLLNNFQALRFTLAHPLQNLYFIFNLAIFGIPILILRIMMGNHAGARRVGFLYLMLWVSTVVFGLIYETRVWLSFVPFLVLVCPIILARRLIDYA